MQIHDHNLIRSDPIRSEQLAVFISDQVPEMLIGDPGRFRQIITNLMGNSIKVSTAKFDLCIRKRASNVS